MKHDNLLKQGDLINVNNLMLMCNNVYREKQLHIHIWNF